MTGFNTLKIGYYRPGLSGVIFAKRFASPSMKIKTLIQGALITILPAIISLASAATLHEGDPAPKLYVSKWIGGEPIQSFQPGTVYLVEFWASWWAPCREPMAHLHRLARKYQDQGLVVIGQNVKDPAPARVESFLKRVGDLMNYRVALDEGATNRYSGRMLAHWLYAAESGIPAALLIDKTGKIVFIGHPNEVDDELIGQVLGGTLDVNKHLRDKAAVAAKEEAWETHNERGKAAFKAKQWTKAMDEIDEMEKLFPRRRTFIQCLRITVLIGQQQLDAASKMALSCANDNLDDPFLQHHVAQTIANHSPPHSAVLATADILMERATRSLHGSDPDFLHTQARLAFLRGAPDKAVQLETKALGLVDSDTSEAFEQALAHYKEGKLPH